MKRYLTMVCAVSLALALLIGLLPINASAAAGAEWTVTFDSRGGSAVPSLTAVPNSLLYAPSEPTRAGYRFAGWYQDKSLKRKWIFEKQKVVGNITLYAKWAELPDAYSGLLRAMNQSRDAVRKWAKPLTIKTINQSVASLSVEERSKLCGLLLLTNTQSADRDVLLRLMNTILSQPALGFYAEIFSYTRINFEGDGFFYWPGQDKVTLTRSSFLSMDEKSKRNTLMHECFHAFNFTNHGPANSLDEGAAIWIYKKVFGGINSAEDWAEATYGTKLYYKVYMNNPGYPIEACNVRKSSPKLIEVYGWLSEGDTSRLPWWDDGLLKAMYQKYYAPLNRDVDFYNVWLPSVEAAKQAMLQDPSMNSPKRIPMPKPKY